jgi:holo-[acyl-carrier protein] synthase
LILGLGVEVVDAERFARAVARFGERLETRLFTDAEREQMRGRVRRAALEGLAARFAAKVAARRALGLAAIAWREVEVVRGPEGPPALRLAGAAAHRAEALGVRRILLSLSHDGGHCIGHVVLENQEP